MSRPASLAVHELCLSLPETTEVISHGAPNYKVRGKSFAIFALNHHGDRRIALWLSGLPGAQDELCTHQPQHYFVPPYVGPRGWVGVQLNTGLSWQVIYSRVCEAYSNVAPKALRGALPMHTAIQPPDAGLALEDADPLFSKPAQQLLSKVREACLALPEVVETEQFGSPTWKAGKRSFASFSTKQEGSCLQFWVGGEQQSLLMDDPRFEIPAYIGHQGWISMRLGRNPDWADVREWVLGSYRHFALKRMLGALNDKTNHQASGQSTSRARGAPRQR